MSVPSSSCTIRARPWRNGTVEAANLPFEQLSDYLAQPDCVALADSRLNVAVQQLTAWTVIAVPTAITGYFVQILQFPAYSTAAGFVVSLLLIVVWCIGLYALFKCKGWL